MAGGKSATLGDSSCAGSRGGDQRSAKQQLMPVQNSLFRLVFYDFVDSTSLTHIMSFFAKLGSGSDTDSDSGSESEESILSGDEGLEQDRKLAAAQKPKNKASMFLKSDDESDEDSSEEEESDSDEDSDEEGGKTVSCVRCAWGWDLVLPERVERGRWRTITAKGRLGRSVMTSGRAPLTAEPCQPILEGRCVER